MARDISRRQFMQVSALTLSASGVALLAGCAPKVAPTAAPKADAQQPAQPPAAAQTQAPATKPTTAAAPAAKEPVTLILNMRAGGEKSEVPIYVGRPTEFMEEHPDIKVELGPIPGDEYETKVQTMAAAGTIGDVMFANCYLGFGRRLIRQNVLSTVDDYLAAANISKSEWLTGAIDTLSFEGKTYGLPKNSHPGELFTYINDDMFEAAGVKVPETFGSKPEDLMEWSTKLAKGPESDRETYGCFFDVTSFHQFSTPVRSFGGYLNNPEGTESMIDSPEWFEWAQFTNSFYRQNLTPLAGTLPSGGSMALFMAQKVGVFIASRSQWNQILAAQKTAGEPFKWRTIQRPRTDNFKGWPANADVHGATTNSKHQDEAFKLVYAMADKRFAELVIKGIGFLTARVDDTETLAALDFDANQRSFIELQYKAQTEEQALRLPANTRGSEITTVYKNEFQKVWLGEEELTKDTMNRIKKMVDEVLAKPF